MSSSLFYQGSDHAHCESELGPKPRESGGFHTIWELCPQSKQELIWSHFQWAQATEEREVGIRAAVLGTFYQ